MHAAGVGRVWEFTYVDEGGAVYALRQTRRGGEPEARMLFPQPQYLGPVSSADRFGPRRSKREFRTWCERFIAGERVRPARRHSFQLAPLHRRPLLQG
ncbi:hypothetical protein [Nocardioides donggukensis]|uniref:Uncharacterized protein n=1 Tax=Nocardioides donggukensis TaxID=2774019 RepID=A0A927PZZ8_9ACTN|nr:hypothetical protein [Nocardioides donggukensis]MBD8869970.1 hypothetical protein [Nocardioides donggukensis]